MDRLITKGAEGVVLSWSVGLWKKSVVKALLGPWRLGVVPTRGCVGVLSWGYKRGHFLASKLAGWTGLPLIYVEEGFIRSTTAVEAPCSIVLDSRCPHYDCTQRSELDDLIERDLTKEEAGRARRLVQLWRETGVSKYNEMPTGGEWGLPEGRYCVIVEQVEGDASLTTNGVGAECFERMLRVATARWPGLRIVVKRHPLSLKSREWGVDGDCPTRCVGTDLGANLSGVVEVGGEVRISTLLSSGRCEACLCATSQVGFEALMHGVPVYCFAPSFYSHRGLTHDEVPAPVVRAAASLEQLVYACLIAYGRYWHPEKGCRVEVEEFVAYQGEKLKQQRDAQERAQPT